MLNFYIGLATGLVAGIIIATLLLLVIGLINLVRQAQTAAKAGQQAEQQQAAQNMFPIWLQLFTPKNRRN
jgi:F0F1-type ATP synthase assembly protein I